MISWQWAISNQNFTAHAFLPNQPALGGIFQPMSKDKTLVDDSGVGKDDQKFVTWDMFLFTVKLYHPSYT